MKKKSRPLPPRKPSRGYFFRRYYDTDKKTKHATVDDPRFADKDIWYCVQYQGWRRSLNLHTSNLTVAKERSQALRSLIKLTSAEKFFTGLIRLGKAAAHQQQRLLNQRLTGRQKPAATLGGKA